MTFVRAARPSDEIALVELDSCSFTAPWVAQAWHEELEAGRVLVAEGEGGAVVGAAVLCIVADTAELRRIATVPRERRRGIARDLLREAGARARAAGCVRIELEVAAENAAALALYSAFGFVVVGRRVGYYRTPPDDAVLLSAAVDSLAPGSSPPSGL